MQTSIDKSMKKLNGLKLSQNVELMNESEMKMILGGGDHTQDPEQECPAGTELCTCDGKNYVCKNPMNCICS